MLSFEAFYEIDFIVYLGAMITKSFILVRNRCSICLKSIAEVFSSLLVQLT